MKRVLIACCLIVISGSAAIAQSAKTSTQSASITTAATDTKAAMTSKINELDGSLSRNRLDLAQPIFNDISGMMQKYMAGRKQDLNNASGSEKATIEKRLEIQEKAYVQAKILSVDLVKNRTEVVAQLNTFLQNL